MKTYTFTLRDASFNFFRCTWDRTNHRTAGICKEGMRNVFDIPVETTKFYLDIDTEPFEDSTCVETVRNEDCVTDYIILGDYAAGIADAVLVTHSFWYLLHSVTKDNRGFAHCRIQIDEE